MQKKLVIVVGNMNLSQFIEKLRELKAQGYVKSLRSGPTGVGQSLEQYLGLKENNLSLPDLEKFELKAHREGSDNLITLFTFNKGAWLLNPLDAIKKYGTPDENGRLGLYFTMTPSVNRSGLYLDVLKYYVSIKHISGEEIVRWKFSDLTEQFNKKLPGLILVYAKSQERNGVEWFNFYSAKLLKGTTPGTLSSAIKNGIILIDLRLHDEGTAARNHGTGFRVRERDLDKIFSYSETLI